MIKCPKCGNTAQLKIINTDFESGEKYISKLITYKCSCGRMFLTNTFYTKDSEEFIIDDNI
jgi:hypothetical protein